jgi:hypothetical protein
LELAFLGRVRRVDEPGFSVAEGGGKSAVKRMVEFVFWGLWGFHRRGGLNAKSAKSAKTQREMSNLDGG